MDYDKEHEVRAYEKAALVYRFIEFAVKHNASEKEVIGFIKNYFCATLQQENTDKIVQGARDYYQAEKRGIAA